MMNYHRTFLLLALSAFISGCATAPKPSLSQASTSPKSQTSGAATWSNILQTHVTEAGRIDFEAMRANPAEINAAADYFATTDASKLADMDAVIAHHLNAYNALAMQHAVNSGLMPSQTIRFFTGSKTRFSGKSMSLHHLENMVIRPFGEPRIHFALNCMVRDCPRLPQTPFDAAQLETQLNAASREFLNDPRRVSFDPTTNTVMLSKILKWYRKDFGPDLLAYVNQYRDVPIPADAMIDWFEYDWTLNQS